MFDPCEAFIRSRARWCRSDHRVIEIYLRAICATIAIQEPHIIEAGVLDREKLRFAARTRDEGRVQPVIGRIGGHRQNCRVSVAAETIGVSIPWPIVADKAGGVALKLHPALGLIHSSTILATEPTEIRNRGSFRAHGHRKLQRLNPRGSDPQPSPPNPTALGWHRGSGEAGERHQRLTFPTNETRRRSPCHRQKSR